MKKILLSALLTAFTLTVFTSCSSDDDATEIVDHNSLQSKIIGNWKLTEVGSMDVNNSTLPNIKNTYIKFNSNGAYSGVGYFGNGEGTYKIDGKIIKTYISNELYMTYEVISIENNIANLYIIEGKDKLKIKAIKQ